MVGTVETQITNELLYIRWLNMKNIATNINCKQPFEGGSTTNDGK